MRHTAGYSPLLNFIIDALVIGVSIALASRLRRYIYTNYVYRRGGK